MSKPWVARTNREVAAKYFKVIRVQEEITWLNVEIHRLHRWVDDEGKHLASMLNALQDSDKPLAATLSAYASSCHHINDIHRRRLNMLYSLDGFTGTPVYSDGGGIASDIDSVGLTLLVDEDDVLNDNMHRLAECIETMQWFPAI
jgi:hypothetical protein